MILASQSASFKAEINVNEQGPFSETLIVSLLLETEAYGDSVT